MDAKQIALKVVLDQLEESDDISNVNDRLRIQKAIYLAQAAGIGLGYHYSWYVKGPYSTSLTQDYYKLSEALRAGDTAHSGLVLNQSLTAIVPRIKSILRKPDDVNVSVPAWYEALASLHFLMTVSKSSEKAAKDFLATVKPHLNDIVDRALSHLRNNGLIA